MEIGEDKVGQVTVIEIKGWVNISAHPERLQQLVRERLRGGERQFLIDLAECEWMDSTGLGELITSFVTVTRQEGQLKLVNVPRPVHGLLTVSNLTQVFEVFDEKQAAIDSFAA